jgi:hypothetical protein
MNSGGNNGWNVLEEESFELSVAQSGGYQYIDVVLGPVDYALSKNPTSFPQVPGFTSLYIAKTKLRIFDRQVIPSYRLWFRADATKRVVSKLWIELCPPAEMGIADDPWDDEEIPF